MEMGRGAVGAPTTPLSPAVGGGGGEGVTLERKTASADETAGNSKEEKGEERREREEAEEERRAGAQENGESSCVCSSRCKADKKAVESDECANERAEADQG
ncbi:uncharacterized protein MONOS_6394 [Monocercomonoides exilis]|uniref:uncharacterized protein n=1 Tax=Monocercomonoides exilis TaxID=2049356 RepID=UPI003559EE57|nr:hypothetical protein MONOS_6394 [Monocercomonoides exilis]|eukprot:MONOS_6394.1-p1 / transcript=MONOS_6394.1 / gene=MONOS_6394 / organism=Monocercomonoides_exilis_PA203 / gene_product=unspecified product / transcript_product=unspecified product / location=Mono_scaffold00200:92434-92871(+) / protein_length=102 / sequence_SO=supercontig / SO=protein_coding / is_pseudo=false